MFDIIIRNGTIIDGSGEPMYKADVGIRDEKIEKIGNLQDAKAEFEIDASYLLVCPGFIDVNNHSDTYWQIFSNPNLESLVHQGITTIVGGNCGSSLAPLINARTIETIQKWANLKQVNFNWLTLRDFFKIVEKKQLAVNFATLVGHATLRRGILKDEMRNPVPKELAVMEKMLKVSMKEGALGMSSGLVYTHARHASIEELVKFCKAVKKIGGVYVTHIRGEQENFLEAIEEAIEIAKLSGVKLHISHLKVMGEKNWPMMDDALAMIDHASESGIDITFDVFPYTNTGTVLYTFLPAWVTDGGKKMMLGRLRNPQIRARVASEMRETGFDYSKIDIAISPLGKTLVKRKISEIAMAQEKSLEDTIIDVLLTSEGRVVTSTEVLSEENIKKEIEHPLSIISTNGSGYNLRHALSGELVHPRSFGTFPKFLAKYVFREKLLKWEEAIKKITSTPAQKFSIKKRGLIKKGYFADIVVLDRDQMKDFATSQNPYQYSKGIDYVLVNGKLVLNFGEYTGNRAGEIIRRNS